MRKIYFLTLLFAVMFFTTDGFSQCSQVRTINGPPSPVCPDVYLVYTTEASMTNYTWNITGGTISGPTNLNTVYVKWTATGPHQLSVNYIDAQSCISASPATFIESVLAAPATPVISGVTSVCAGVDVTYTTASGMQNYDWSYPPPAPAGPAQPYAALMAGGDGYNYVTLRWMVGFPATDYNRSIFVSYKDPAVPTGCASTGSLPVDVKNAPGIGVSGVNNICLDGTDTEPYFLSISSGTLNNIQWSVSGGQPGGHAIASGQGTPIANINWILPGTYTVTVSGNSSTASCTLTATTTVTVNQVTTLNVSGPTSVCTNTTTTYTTEAGKPNYNWSVTGGIIVSGNGTNTIGVSWPTAVAGTIGVTYQVNGCVSSIAPMNVTASGASIAGSATSCLGAANVLYSTAAGMSNYTWTVSAGGTITSGVGTNSIAVNWGTSGAKTVSVNFTGSVNGCSLSSPIEKSVSVYAPVVPAITTSIPSPCTLTPVNYIATPSSGLNFQWNASAGVGQTVPLSPMVFQMVWPQTAALSGQTVTLNYTDVNGCLSTVVKDVTIKASPIPTVSGPTELCHGSINIPYSTETGKSSYLWTITSPNILATPNNVSSVTSNWYSAGSITVRYADPNGCSGATTKTVASLSPRSTITGSTTICIGESADVSVALTGTAPWNLTYTDGTTPVSVTGIMNSPYVFSVSPTTTKTYSITALGDAFCPTSTNFTGSATITINSISPGAISNGSAVVCGGGNPTIYNSTTSATGSGTISYQWYSSIDGINFSSIAGATISSYDPVPGVVQTTHYQRRATSTVNGSGCSASVTKTVLVNVVNAGTIGNDQVTCSSDPSAFVVITPASGTGALTYQWLNSSNDLNYYDVSGATSATYDASNIYSKAYYKRKVFSNYNGLICSALTNNNTPITITPNLITSVGGISGNQTICAGGDPVAFTSTAVGSGPGTGSYQWRKSTNNVNFVDIPGATGLTYDVPAGDVTQTTYYVRAFTSTLNGVGCTGMSVYLTVTVNPISGGIVGSNQVICSGGDPVPFTQATEASGSGTLSQQWQSSTDGLTFPTNVGTSTTYNPPVLTQTTYYRRVSTFSSGGVNCSTNSNVLTVTVNPIPSVTTPDKTMCSDQQVMLPLTSTVPETTTYSWSVFTKSNPISGVTVGQTGTLNPIDNVLSNSSPNLIGTVTFRVTPTAAGCVGPYKDVIVSVNPKISAGTISGNQTICAGGNPTAFTHTVPSGLSSLDYQWQSSPNYSGTYQDLAGVKTAAYDIPAGEVTETTSYRRFVKGTQNGIECSTVTAPITVTVNKVTGNLITGDQIICVNGDPAEITEALTPTWLGSLTHSWKKSINGTSFSTISGATSKTYDPSSITQTTYYKRIATTVYNGTTCATESNVVTKTVEKPVVSATTPTQFCEATSVNATLVTAFNPNYLYRWFRNGSLLNGETSSTLNTTQTGSYHVEVTNQLTTCTNISSPDIVVSTPVGQIFADGDLCINGTVVLSTTSGHDDNHSWKVNGIIDHYYDDKPYFTVYDPATISVDYTPAGCPGSTVTASIDIYRNGSTCIYARVRSEEPQVETTQESSQIHGVYPNPASSKITVSIPKAVEHDLEVLLVSQIGYTILSGVIPKGEITTTLDSKNIAEGIYYVKVKSQVETMFTRKVVVRH